MPCCCLQADEATLAVVQRHLLRSTGTDALDALLTWCKYEFVEQDAPGAVAADGAAAAAGGCSFAGPIERSAVVKALPPDVGQPMARALEAANGADVQVGMVHCVFMHSFTYSVSASLSWGLGL